MMEEKKGREKEKIEIMDHHFSSFSLILFLLFHLLLRAKSRSGHSRSSSLLLFVHSLGVKSHVVSSLFSALLDTGDLLGEDSLLSVDGKRSYQSLDLRSLDDGLALSLEDSRNDSLSDIIGLFKVEKLSDVGSSLRSKTLGDGDISQTFNLTGSLSEDDQVKDGKIGSDDATSNRLSLSLTNLSGSVARLTLLQEQSNSVVGDDTLLHGETLEIVTSGDSEKVTSPFLTKTLTLNFLSDSLVVEVSKDGFIINFEVLLGTSTGECNVELHCKCLFCKKQRKQIGRAHV